MSSFTFSDCPTTVALAEAQRDGKKVATGSLSLTVRNVTNRSLIGTLRVEPDDMAQSGWFKIAGASPTSPAERDIDCEANATQTVQVDIAVPEGAPAGRKVFSLRVATERDPDNDFTDSPAVAFEVKAPAPKVVQKKPFPWWIAAVAVVAVAVVGGVFWALRPAAPLPPSPPPAPTTAATKPTVPTGIKGKDLQAAINRLGAAGITIDLNDLVRQLTRSGGPGRFQIFDVAPGEGASINPNQQVRLTVGQIVPNDLKDKDLRKALDSLRHAGIDVDTVHLADQLFRQAPGNPQVTDVKPDEGQQIKPGDTIRLEIKRTVPMGLKNQDLPTVADRLTEAGIFIDVRDLLDKVAAFPKGQKLVVSGLNPDEGQTVRPSDRVRLTIIGR